ncbi:hypothetical protein LCGC14_0922850 [marine sediment metagenome]|uniref:Lipase n=1 Tax=marine sediment metagenome TaxID=412755 RepID=A0A0F9NQ97_9ZZZZ|nr:DUF4389 domain-containing protein [Methylophaga sp.]HEC58096.1 DUF4389 domain-containing protein [Methylophaga sp.]
MDNQEIKNNITDSNQWVRIIYMALFGAILYLVMMVLCLVVVVQAIVALVTGGPNPDILRFSKQLVRYLREIAAFLTYTDDTRPYPFQAWQTTASESDIVDAEYQMSASDNNEKPDIKPDV